MSSHELPLIDDCAHCLGLCCVLLGFTASPDFAEDKEAGTPCRHLDDTHRCRIHGALTQVGYRGCVAFSCFGSGPTLTRAAEGRTWVGDTEMRQLLARAFPTARQLHELAWYLREADRQRLPTGLRRRLAAARSRIDEVARSPLEDLVSLDVAAHWIPSVDLLNEVSELLRGPRPGRDLRSAELIGASLRGADLSRANLRGARLIAADLRDANLTLADLTGADLRDARLDGADLSAALFVTPGQLVVARVDATTRLPSPADPSDL